MLHRDPLHFRVSPETRQRLQLLRTQRHLNVGSWLRALIDEALNREFGPVPPATVEHDTSATAKSLALPGWRTAISGFMPLARMLDMISLRRFGSQKILVAVEVVNKGRNY